MVICPNAFFQVGNGRIPCQYIKVFSQIVAPQLLKTGKESTRPVGAIYFVGIVVKSPHTVVLFCKNAGKGLQIGFYRTRIEMIQHPAFSTRSSAFYFLSGRHLVQGIKFTVLSVLPGDSFAQVEFLEKTLTGKCRNRHQQCPFPLIGYSGQCGDFFSSFHLNALNLKSLCGIRCFNLRAAIRPARTQGHVYSQTKLLRLNTGIIQHFEPLRTQVRHKIGLFPLHPINWNDVHSPEARSRKIFQVFANVGFVDGAAHPPPVCPGLGGVGLG